MHLEEHAKDALLYSFAQGFGGSCQRRGAAFHFDMDVFKVALGTLLSGRTWEASLQLFTEILERRRKREREVKETSIT